MEESYNISSEGYANLYYNNKECEIICTRDVATVYIKHNLCKTIKGLLYVVVTDELRDRFVYPLDTILYYDGEDNIKINLYNYGNKPVYINDKDLICNLIVNELEEVDSD